MEQQELKSDNGLCLGAFNRKSECVHLQQAKWALIWKASVLHSANNPKGRVRSLYGCFSSMLWIIWFITTVVCLTLALSSINTFFLFLFLFYRRLPCTQAGWCCWSPSSLQVHGKQVTSLLKGRKGTNHSHLHSCLHLWPIWTSQFASCACCWEEAGEPGDNPRRHSENMQSSRIESSQARG